MTGQDFQDKLDAVVLDLQTAGKGQAVEILMRGTDNSSNVYPLSSDANGVVNAGQLSAIQAFINGLKPIADTYEQERAPVQTALEAFNARRATHQTAIDAASSARTALNTELTADATYQSLQTALESERAEPVYIAAVAAYRDNNVSENFGNLGDAKGKYVAP